MKFARTTQLLPQVNQERRNEDEKVTDSARVSFPRLHLRVRPLEPFCVYVQGTQFGAKVSGVSDWCACARQQLARLSSAMFHCVASTILFWFAWRCARCEQKLL